MPGGRHIHFFGMFFQNPPYYYAHNICLNLSFSQTNGVFFVKEASRTLDVFKMQPLSDEMMHVGL